MTLSPKVIVLDFDGIILESADIKTRAFRQLFTPYPEHLDKIVQFHLDNVGISRFEKFRAVYRDFLGRSIGDEELADLDREFSSLVYREILTCPFVGGAYPFLQTRSQHHDLYVASGTPQHELQDIVERRGLSKYFAGVYGSPETKPEILRGVMARHELPPSELVFIGDALSDYQAAREAGVPFIGRVPRGQAAPFPDEGLVTTIEDLHQLDQEWASLPSRLASALKRP